MSDALFDAEEAVETSAALSRQRDCNNCGKAIEPTSGVAARFHGWQHVEDRSFTCAGDTLAFWLNPIIPKAVPAEEPDTRAIAR